MGSPSAMMQGRWKASYRDFEEIIARDFLACSTKIQEIYMFIFKQSTLSNSNSCYSNFS